MKSRNLGNQGILEILEIPGILEIAKMESGTECTVCAILKMSSDNSSFETGVGILWLMCTWAFQVLYSRA